MTGTFYHRLINQESAKTGVPEKKRNPRSTYGVDAGSRNRATYVRGETRLLWPLRYPCSPLSPMHVNIIFTRYKLMGLVLGRGKGWGEYATFVPLTCKWSGNSNDSYSPPPLFARDEYCWDQHQISVDQRQHSVLMIRVYQKCYWPSVISR